MSLELFFLFLVLIFLCGDLCKCSPCNTHLECHVFESNECEMMLGLAFYGSYTRCFGLSNYEEKDGDDDDDLIWK